MRVVAIDSKEYSWGKETYMTTNTGHYIINVQFLEGIEETHIYTPRGKRVPFGNTTWLAADKAMWNTNPTRSRY